LPDIDPDRLPPEQLAVLVDIAAEAIDDALAGRRTAPRSPAELPAALRERRGAFVTLEVGGGLNGCIGTIEGDAPLAHDVARLAVEAAFADPRLPALRTEDLPELEIEVSVLSPLQPLPCASRPELLDALRPGTDGLLIGAGRHRAVFLPDVWASLPEPEAFLDHLLRKAGLRPGSWPRGAWAQRFTTQRASRRWDDHEAGRRG
jgi:AmmeMemoRadiSam system protein A